MDKPKLVRDRIPEIIEKSGRKPIFSVLEDEEYSKMLLDKLVEEAEEVKEAEEKELVEELADVLELVRAIASYNGHTNEELEKVREEKAKKNGTFKEKYLLKGVEE